MKAFTTPDGQEFADKREFREYMMKNYYSFKNLQNVHATKHPGDIGGQVFEISDCSDADLAVLDITEQVQIDNLVNCRVFIGACSSSIFVRNCSDCIFYTCSMQLRLREVTNSSFYTFCQSEVHMELSSSLSFGPFLGGYEKQKDHFEEIGFKLNASRWFDIYDHNDPDKVRKNWKLLSEDKYAEEWFPLGKCESYLKLSNQPTIPSSEKGGASTSNQAISHSQVGKSYGLDQMMADAKKMDNSKLPKQSRIRIPIESALLIVTAASKGINLSVWFNENGNNGRLKVNDFISKLTSLSSTMSLNQDAETKRELDTAVSMKSQRAIIAACNANAARKQQQHNNVIANITTDGDDDEDVIDITYFLKCSQQTVDKYIADMEANSSDGDSSDDNNRFMDDEVYETIDKSIKDAKSNSQSYATNPSINDNIYSGKDREPLDKKQQQQQLQQEQHDDDNAYKFNFDKDDDLDGEDYNQDDYEDDDYELEEATTTTNLVNTVTAADGDNEDPTGSFIPLRGSGNTVNNAIASTTMSRPSSAPASRSNYSSSSNRYSSSAVDNNNNHYGDNSNRNRNAPATSISPTPLRDQLTGSNAKQVVSQAAYDDEESARFDEYYIEGNDNDDNNNDIDEQKEDEYEDEVGRSVKHLALTQSNQYNNDEDNNNIGGAGNRTVNYNRNYNSINSSSSSYNDRKGRYNSNEDEDDVGIDEDEIITTSRVYHHHHINNNNNSNTVRGGGQQNNQYHQQHNVSTYNDHIHGNLHYYDHPTTSNTTAAAGSAEHHQHQHQQQHWEEENRRYLANALKGEPKSKASPATSSPPFNNNNNNSSSGNGNNPYYLQQHHHNQQQQQLQQKQQQRIRPSSAGPRSNSNTGGGNNNGTAHRLSSTAGGDVAIATMQQHLLQLEQQRRNPSVSSYPTVPAAAGGGTSSSFIPPYGLHRSSLSGENSSSPVHLHSQHHHYQGRAVENRVFALPAHSASVDGSSAAHEYRLRRRRHSFSGGTGLGVSNSSSNGAADSEQKKLAAMKDTVEDLVRNTVKKADLYHIIQVSLGFIERYTLVPPRGAIITSCGKHRVWLSCKDIQTAFTAARLNLSEPQILLLRSLVFNFAQQFEQLYENTSSSSSGKKENELTAIPSNNNSCELDATHAVTSSAAIADKEKYLVESVLGLPSSSSAASLSLSKYSLSSIWLKRYLVHLRLTKKTALPAAVAGMTPVTVITGNTTITTNNATASSSYSRDGTTVSSTNAVVGQSNTNSTTGIADGAAATMTTTGAGAVSSSAVAVPLRWTDWLGRKMQGEVKKGSTKPREFEKALSGQHHPLSKEDIELMLRTYNVLPTEVTAQEVECRIEAWLLDMDGRRDFQHELNVKIRRWIWSKKMKEEHMKLPANEKGYWQIWQKLPEQQKKEVKGEILNTIIQEKREELLSIERNKSTITKELYWKFDEDRKQRNINWTNWLKEHIAKFKKDLEDFRLNEQNRMKRLASQRSKQRSVAGLNEVQHKLKKAQEEYQMDSYHQMELQKAINALRRTAMIKGVAKGTVVTKEDFDRHIKGVLAPYIVMNNSNSSNDDAVVGGRLQEKDINGMFHVELKKAVDSVVELEKVRTERSKQGYMEWLAEKKKEREALLKRQQEKADKEAKEKLLREKRSKKEYKKWCNLRKKDLYRSTVDNKPHHIPVVHTVVHKDRWNCDKELNDYYADMEKKY